MFIAVAFSGFFILDAPVIADGIIVNFFAVATALPVIVSYTEGMELFSDVIAVSPLCRCRAYSLLYLLLAQE